jgi:anti-sigma factor RsiW
MTLSHEDANARLLDLVYGEAAPDERAALEAHVATCPRCTAELASLGGTRARVRAALDEDAPVPPRVRANLLAAAREAVAAVPAKVEPPLAAAAAPARKVVPASEPSLWDRLRGKWTLPTFATVGAVAVVVIASKVFLEPQRTMERGVEMVKGAPAAAPSAPAEPARSFARREAASEPSAGASAGARADEADSERAVRDGKRAHASASRAKREAASPNDGLSGLVGVGGGAAPGPDRLGGLGAMGSGRGAVAPSPARAAAKERKAAGLDDLLEGAPANRAASANRAPGAPRSDAPAEAEAKPAAREGYAQPPSGWKGDGRAALGSASSAAKDDGAEPAAPKATAQADRAPAPAAAPVAAAPPPPAPELAKKKAAAPAKPSAAPARARAEEPDRASDDASAQATLARRADELFSAHRWPDAIAAYRELLRRWPDAPLKPRWRDRLAQSQAESAKAAAPAAR